MTANVLHYDRTDGVKTFCGKRLPTAGFTTDEVSLLVLSPGERCLACWRRLVSHGLVTERAS